MGQHWEYGDDYDHFYNSDSQAALAAEETPTAFPLSEDVNTTEDAKLQHQHLQAMDDCPYSDGFNIEDVCLWQYANDYGLRIVQWLHIRGVEVRPLSWRPGRRERQPPGVRRLCSRTRVWLLRQESLW